MKHAEMQRVTVLLPRELLARPTAATGQGLTATIRQGLETVPRAAACDGLRQLRGKVKLSINVDELRED